MSIGRVFWCDECGDAFDQPQPVCRQVGCEARVCRNCRDERGACASCCREELTMVAFRAEWDRREMAALLAVVGF